MPTLKLRKHAIKSFNRKLLLPNANSQKLSNKVLVMLVKNKEGVDNPDLA